MRALFRHLASRRVSMADWSEWLEDSVVEEDLAVMMEKLR
jgi:hypothetical protein